MAQQRSWQGHKTAAVGKVKGKTGTFQGTIMTAAQMNAAAPNPLLAGLRVKLPNHDEVYLIDPEGYRRWVPDPYTYDKVFRDWNGIVTDISINDISLGPALVHGACLIRADDSTPVYLVSSTKRWITSAPVMDKYYFKWPTGGDVVSPAVANALPAGGSWS